MLSPHIKNIEPSHKSFPQSLKEVKPVVRNLFVRGDLEALSRPAIAIAGTRKATATGLKIAEDIAYDLAVAGFVIVSGLAIGIDSAAHRGALKAGGKTIAVLGNGVAKIYPAQNEDLAREILASSGSIVAESDLGNAGHRGIFLERNRIITGLAIAAVIVEAPFKSGSVNTAGWAAEQGKPVFVIPGPVSHANYKGSHLLIRDGATLATGAKDILEDLGVPTEASIKETSREELCETEDEKAIFALIKNSERSLTLDELAVITSKNISEISATITVLSLKSLIIETPSGYAASR